MKKTKNIIYISSDKKVKKIVKQHKKKQKDNDCWLIFSPQVEVKYISDKK